MKALVARALAKRVQDGEVIGLGSGSTAEMAIDQIGQRVQREKISIAGVPTSIRTALIAAEAGIDVRHPIPRLTIDWAFDGADEVDPNFNMIKGRGAAMLTEKIIARRASRFVVIVSEDKIVKNLGDIFAVPVEVIPEALPLVEDGLRALGATEMVLRQASQKYGPVITEHKNVILDTKFGKIVPELEGEISKLVGVVESGLFTNFNQEVLLAKKDGVWSQKLVNGVIQEELIEAP
jgi:ribose 5-phosphate isomerase A